MIPTSPISGKQKQLADIHSKTQKKKVKGKTTAENSDIASAFCYDVHNFTRAILKVCMLFADQMLHEIAFAEGTHPYKSW
jgi:hypothetical protein